MKGTRFLKALIVRSIPKQVTTNFLLDERKERNALKNSKLFLDNDRFDRQDLQLEISQICSFEQRVKCRTNTA